VVAHLAARHRIRVQLLRAEPTGVTALVVIPAALLVPTETADDRRPAPTTAPPPAEPPSVAELVDDVPEPEPEPAPVAEAAEEAPEPEPAPAAEVVEEAPEPEPATVGTAAGPAPTASNGTGNGNGKGAALTARVPGTHLTHRPGETASPVDGEVRPRPERVHDLLSRHERGKRDGHGKGYE